MPSLEERLSDAADRAGKRPARIKPDEPPCRYAEFALKRPCCGHRWWCRNEDSQWHDMPVEGRFCRGNCKDCVPPDEAEAAEIPATDATTLRLENNLAFGDAVVLSAAVRDLHRAHPGEYLTEMRTSCQPIWENHPLHTPIEGEPDRVLDCRYPAIHQSNQCDRHFISAYHAFLEKQLGVEIPLTEFRGDLHLSDEEKRWMNQVQETHGWAGPFWLIFAGGKHDFTAKWWRPDYWQQVVEHFKGRIRFVQAGSLEHWHPALEGVLDLRGKTDIRQLLRLIYHADGLICPVTGAMHAAAALPKKGGQARACVVIAGGREPVQWEHYPAHQYLHTVGCLDCCADGGCWRSRCAKVGDGDEKDEKDLCRRPVRVSEELTVTACMDMVKPLDVIRAVERYYEGGALTSL